MTKNDENWQKIAKKMGAKKFLVDFGGKYASNVNKNNGIRKALMRALKCTKFCQNPIMYVGVISAQYITESSGKIIIQLIPWFENSLCRFFGHCA